MKTIIERLKENIARLESTLRKNCWSAGYVAECRRVLACHREALVAAGSEVVL
jgi:hypothetical protein